MKKVQLTVVSMAIAVLVVPGAFGARAVKGRTLLLVPAVERAVSFAFDVAIMRPVDIVSYQAVPESTMPALHVWDPGVRDWMRTTVDEMEGGRLFKESPVCTVLLGTGAMIPDGLEQALPALPRLVRIPTLDIATVVNQSDAVFAFGPYEWKWLSRRYGFDLKDHNFARRRWGRYGPPGADARRPLATFPEVQDEVEPMPFDILEEPAMAAPAPSERQRIVIPIGEPSDAPVFTEPAAEPETYPAMPADTPLGPLPEDK